MADLPRRFDLVLYKTLSNIFRELSRSEIVDFLRAPEHSTDRYSVVELILEQDNSFLSQHFTNEVELGKLSLLWIAVCSYYQKSAELLVRCGADVNELCGSQRFLVPIDRKVFKIPVEKDSTLLHVLIEMESSPENERLIRLVTNHGADLEARDYEGRSVLHYALTKGRVKVAEMLLQKGAEVNAADSKGETPLFAAIGNSIELLPLLIKLGADVTAKNEDGGNALHDMASFGGTKQASIDAARALIQTGVSLDDRDEYQDQPIHRAVYAANDIFVKLYLDHGANVNAETKDGKFPLYIIVTGPHSGMKLAMLGILLERGANIDQRTNKGRTALHAACSLFSGANLNDDDGTMKLLVSAGADVLIEDCDGNTPFALIDRDFMVEPDEPEILLVIKTLALRKVCQPSLELKDIRIMKEFPNLWNYYQGCIEELDRMKLTRFIENCTFFDLLAKSHCRIAELMRNHEFVIKFIIFDYPSIFSKYSDDLLRAFERAEYHYHSMLKQEDVINKAIYDTLPHMVVRKVTRYILNLNDCCKNLK